MVRNGTGVRHRTSGRRKRWAVFLDRDGTLLQLVPYLKDPARARLYKGVGAGLRRLRDAGAALVLVTNQSGVARGLMTRRDVAVMHRRLADILAEEGVRLDRIEVCFDHPDFSVACDCRKPAPGMLLNAAKKLRIDLESSWTIGDNVSDLEAGEAAGTNTALVLTGYGAATRKTTAGRRARVVGRSLQDVAERIAKEMGGGERTRSGGDRRRSR